MKITNSCFRPGLDTDTTLSSHLHNATEAVPSFTALWSYGLGPELQLGPVTPSWAGWSLHGRTPARHIQPSFLRKDARATQKETWGPFCATSSDVPPPLFPEACLCFLAASRCLSLSSLASRLSAPRRHPSPRGGGAQQQASALSIARA